MNVFTFADELSGGAIKEFIDDTIAQIKVLPTKAKELAKETIDRFTTFASEVIAAIGEIDFKAVFASLVKTATAEIQRVVHALALLWFAV